jgi:hypothetical protein
MSKSQLTRTELVAALQRILSGKAQRISPDRKLTVKAVEEEAGLGNGSAYYYPDIVQDIKQAANKKSHSMLAANKDVEKLSDLKLKLQHEIRLKEQYRTELINIKARLALMASQHNQQSIIIQQYKEQMLSLDIGNISHPSSTPSKKRSPT